MFLCLYVVLKFFSYGRLCVGTFVGVSVLFSSRHLFDLLSNLLYMVLCLCVFPYFLHFTVLYHHYRAVLIFLDFCLSCLLFINFSMSVCLLLAYTSVLVFCTVMCRTVPSHNDAVLIFCLMLASVFCIVMCRTVPSDNEAVLIFV